MINFQDKLQQVNRAPLQAVTLDTLQINVGKLCNQTCRHCHVDAGPTRTEVMTRETAELVADVLKRHSFTKIDITGGAPELNPNFEYLTTKARALHPPVHVMDRSNLTVFYEKGKGHLPEFLAEQKVEVIASLPCYTEVNVDAQRGLGVFNKSVEALQWLNRLGYGHPDSGLILNLVYNPLGATLPPPQKDLEKDYKSHLRNEFGIEFNRLYAITNMPINRFLKDLNRQGAYTQYMELLLEKFNPATVGNIMCQSLISVGWDGTLYDCDFNQMLEMPVIDGLPRHIRDFDHFLLARRKIFTGNHCYGCTAGNGSSCSGTLN